MLNVHATQRLADWLKIKNLPSTQGEVDALFSWRANFVTEEDYAFIAFMNDATRFVVVLNKPDKTDAEDIAAAFFDTLRGTLLIDNVNPSLIDRYIEDCGAVSFVRNNGRADTAFLNKSVRNVWYSTRNFAESIPMSYCSSHMSVDPVIGNDYFNRKNPAEKFISELERYGTPILCGTAFDLTARLDLDGHDAVRKLRVSANMTFEQFHRVLQRAFGWQDRHLHQFGIYKNSKTGYHDRPDVELVGVETFDPADYDDNAKSAVGVKLRDYLPEYQNIVYNYDFGDDWLHYITLDAVVENNADQLPRLLAGEGDAPPEDIGGSIGFAQFMRTLSDESDKDFQLQVSWAKEQNWERFDFERVGRYVWNSLNW